MLAILTKWCSIYTIMQGDDTTYAEKRGRDVGHNLANLAIFSGRGGLLEHLVEYFVKLSHDADANFRNCTPKDIEEYVEYGPISWVYTQHMLDRFARSAVGNEAFEMGGDGDFGGGDEGYEMDGDDGYNYDMAEEGGGAPQDSEVTNGSGGRPPGLEVDKGSDDIPRGFRMVKGELVARPCADCRKRRKACPHKKEKLRRYREQQARLRGKKQQRSTTE
jgi:hypothetical protein